MKTSVSSYDAGVDCMIIKFATFLWNRFSAVKATNFEEAPSTMSRVRNETLEGGVNKNF